MENKTQLPENILIILEIKAKRTGKPLNEVIEEYKKTLERGKKALEIIERIRSLTNGTTADVLKEVYHTAGVKVPIYKRFTAPYSYKRIKENDTLIFNMDYTELKDGKIYLFNFKIGGKEFLLYAEYSKELNSFILEDKPKKIIEVDEDIEILGALIKIRKGIVL